MKEGWGEETPGPFAERKVGMRENESVPYKLSLLRKRGKLGVGENLVKYEQRGRKKGILKKIPAGVAFPGPASLDITKGGRGPYRSAANCQLHGGERGTKFQTVGVIGGIFVRVRGGGNKGCFDMHIDCSP